MEEIIALAQKLGGVSFATLLFLIGVGSYFDVWVWGRQLRETKAEGAARLLAAERDRDEWKSMALSAAGLAETSVDLAKRRG